MISKYLPKKSARQVNYRYCILSPSKKGKWSKEEDVNLLFLVEKFERNWEEVAKFIQTRTPVQCYTHWKYNYGRLFNRKAANLNLLE